VNRLSSNPTRSVGIAGPAGPSTDPAFYELKAAAYTAIAARQTDPALAASATALASAVNAYAGKLRRARRKPGRLRAVVCRCGVLLRTLLAAVPARSARITEVECGACGKWTRVSHIRVPAMICRTCDANGAAQTWPGRRTI
jgi:hypothetical protein